MAGHISYNKRENISIVDLVISPSDHIQAQKIRRERRGSQNYLVRQLPHWDTIKVYDGCCKVKAVY